MFNASIVRENKWAIKSEHGKKEGGVRRRKRTGLPKGNQQFDCKCKLGLKLGKKKFLGTSSIGRKIGINCHM